MLGRSFFSDYFRQPFVGLKLYFSCRGFVYISGEACKAAKISCGVKKAERWLRSIQRKDCYSNDV